MHGDFKQARDHLLRDLRASSRAFPERLLAIQDARVRRPAPNPFRAQTLDDRVSRKGETVLDADDVLIVRMEHPVPLERRRQAFDLRDPLGEATGVLPPSPYETVQLSELHEPDRGGDLRHPIVVAHEHMVVLRPLAMVPEEAADLGDLRVVGKNHPALPGRHVLRWIERETRGVPEVPRLLPVVLSPVSLARVFEHDEVVRLRDLVDRLHLSGLAIEVHRHHDSRTLRHGLLERGRVKRVEVPVNICKGGRPPAEQHRCSAREECQRWDDDLVAPAHPMGEESDMERGRPTVHRDAVATADVFRETLFELGDPRALRELTALEDIKDRPLLLVPEERLGNRDRGHDLRRSVAHISVSQRAPKRGADAGIGLLARGQVWTRKKSTWFPLNRFFETWTASFGTLHSRRPNATSGGGQVFLSAFRTSKSPSHRAFP